MFFQDILVFFFFSFFLFSFSFLSRGLTIAVSKSGGTKPDNNVY